MSETRLPSLPASEIRERFLDYFENEHHHTRIDGASIVPRNDPTLLFINSGMAPLKPYFTGEEQPPSDRLANAQICIRTNDIDVVGDSHHGTSFTMLGNWSFGSYGKQHAIDMAMGLLTERLGFDVCDLSATYYRGDLSRSDVPADEVSRMHWLNFLEEQKVLGALAKDNFWGPAGDYGPCGPCTEVFYDRGRDYGNGVIDDLGLEDERQVEIWNAGVFMEYYQDKDGVISDLGRLCVDAGAGLERIAMIMQNTDSIHQIDRFLPAYEFVRAKVGTDHEARVVFDHLKTSIIIAESGVFPSNQGAGYIVRKLLRRAWSNMDANGVPLNETRDFVDVTAANMDHPLKRELTINSVNDIFTSESNKFTGVLRRAEKVRQKIINSGEITGKQAFDAVTSQGIPVEIIKDVCIRSGLDFPQSEYDFLMLQHQKKSKNRQIF